MTLFMASSTTWQPLWAASGAAPISAVPNVSTTMPHNHRTDGRKIVINPMVRKLLLRFIFLLLLLANSMSYGWCGGAAGFLRFGGSVGFA